MPFIKNTREKITDYYRDLLQPQLIPVSTVHDEVDYLCDSHLLKPIMKTVADISAVKPIIDKLGLPFINFLFDIEWGEHGCWSPEYSFDYFLYPKTESEAKAKARWEKELKLLQGDSSEEKESSVASVVAKVVKIEYNEYDIDEALMEKLMMCEKGSDIFVINLNNGKQAVMTGIDLQGWKK